MVDIKNSNQLSFAVFVARLAGKEIMDVYASDFNIENKNDNSPLTLADKNAQKIIQEYLKLTNIEILSEEGAHEEYSVRKNWKKLWVVDPLDGTKEFIKRNGEFTVNIALVENGYPVLGVIYAPFLNEMYWAQKGKGVYFANIDYNGAYDLDDTALIVTSAKKLDTQNNLPAIFTVIASRSHMSAETQNYIEQKKKEFGEINIISAGSALKFCLIAAGKAHAYPRFAPTMEWDTAAGQIIVEEAGKSLIDFGTNEKMIYNREKLLNNWFLVE